MKTEINSSATITESIHGKSDQMAPMLAGASCGTISSAAPEASVIAGVNTAGSVRVVQSSNLESLLTIGANGAEAGGLIWGIFLFATCFRKLSVKSKILRTVSGCLVIAGALLIPSVTNWLVASGCGGNLFN